MKTLEKDRWTSAEGQLILVMSDFETENVAAANSGADEPDLLDSVSDEQETNQVPEQQEEILEDDVEDTYVASSADRKGDAIREWKEQRDAEIEARDQADLEAKARLQEAAIKHIDDFYENYNRKKAQQLEAVKSEAEEFLRKKNEFFSQENTTTWDRVLQLINEDDADILGGRDRSKFKEILQRLRGNPNAPGA